MLVACYINSSVKILRVDHCQERKLLPMALVSITWLAMCVVYLQLIPRFLTATSLADHILCFISTKYLLSLHCNCISLFLSTLDFSSSRFHCRFRQKSLTIHCFFFLAYTAEFSVNGVQSSMLQIFFLLFNFSAFGSIFSVVIASKFSSAVQ